MRELVAAGKDIGACAAALGIPYAKVNAKLQTKRMEGVRRPKWRWHAKDEAPHPMEPYEPPTSDDLVSADAKWAAAFATASATFQSVQLKRSYDYQELLEGGPSL